MKCFFCGKRINRKEESSIVPWVGYWCFVHKECEKEIDEIRAKEYLLKMNEAEEKASKKKCPFNAGNDVTGLCLTYCCQAWGEFECKRLEREE